MIHAQFSPREDVGDNVRFLFMLNGLIRLSHQNNTSTSAENESQWRMQCLLVAYLQVFRMYFVCTHISAKYGIMKWRHKLLDQNKVKGQQERPARCSAMLDDFRSFGGKSGSSAREIIQVHRSSIRDVEMPQKNYE